MGLPRPFSEAFVADCLRLAIVNNGYGVDDAHGEMWHYIAYYELLAVDDFGRYYATARGQELMDRYPPVKVERE